MRKLRLIFFLIALPAAVFAQDAELADSNGEALEDSEEAGLSLPEGNEPAVAQEMEASGLFGRSNVYFDGSMAFSIQRAFSNAASSSGSSASALNTGFSLSFGAGYFVADGLDINGNMEFSVQGNAFSFSFLPGITCNLPITKVWSYSPSLKLGFSFIESYFAFSVLLNPASFQVEVGKRLLLEMSLMNLIFSHAKIEGVSANTILFNIGTVSLSVKYFF